MSQTDGTFPRRIIRYAQLGMKDALLSSKELWTCYQCGECAETCPTQADPSEFMAATRRYAIASYDKTRLARTMYTRPIVATVLAVAPRRCSSPRSCTPPTGRWPASRSPSSTFIPEELIHNTGIVVMILVVLAGLAGVGDDGPRHRPHARACPLERRARARAGGARPDRSAPCGPPIGRESLGQVRFREECEADAVARPCPGTGAAGSSTRSSCGASSACSPPPGSTTGSR